MFARITGIGSFLPGQAVSNDDLARRGIETSDEWITSRTGISFRHLAEDGQTASDLGLEAGRRALVADDCAACGRRPCHGSGLRPAPPSRCR